MTDTSTQHGTGRASGPRSTHATLSQTSRSLPPFMSTYIHVSSGMPRMAGAPPGLSGTAFRVKRSRQQISIQRFIITKTVMCLSHLSHLSHRHPCRRKEGNIEIIIPQRSDLQVSHIPFYRNCGGVVLIFDSASKSLRGSSLYRKRTVLMARCKCSDLARPLSRAKSALSPPFSLPSVRVSGVVCPRIIGEAKACIIALFMCGGIFNPGAR